LADENKRFVDEFANPHAWLMMADNLHEQATQIYEGRSRSTITTTLDANKEIVRQTRGIDKPVFLLGGFALENAIKAFLVYENPSWVSNGRLSGKLRSHSLTRLQKHSRLIPYRKTYTHVLKAFESGLDSWFRYPCALTAQDTKREDPLFDELWAGYGKIMRAYGKKLGVLLSKGWNGPHGTYGLWTIQGQSLGYRTHPSTRYSAIQDPSKQEIHKGKPIASGTPLTRPTRLRASDSRKR
jgi:hypothetical protein